ncbi:MAG: alanine--glyoxylate aminotransferase family protein [Chloroflexi bacterium]|nr:alanine--glyoxylate aminotransferase family protein [Chloroflexota bacterium]
MKRDYPPQRILMAPGPSNVHPRVLQALSAPLVGHKDPYYLGVMEDTADLLRRAFQTTSAATLALPASGGSGMEAALINLLEPGDTVVIADGGFFAHRMVDIAQRLPEVKVLVVAAAWGAPVAQDQLLAAVRQYRPRVLAVVHGETSTGVEQPLGGLAEACHEVGSMLVVDAVATLGGVRLPVDELGIDICYSGSQKCLSAPPGLAPMTLSDRARQAIAQRRTPVQSWYLDLGLHARLWGAEHIYHHTSPVLNVYALREALRMIDEEGLDQRFARHCVHAAALRAGLEALGLRQFAVAEHRLASVVTVLAPSGVSAAAVRNIVLDEFNLEISGGLGDYTDRMWRIGIMGHSAQQANVMLCLVALEHGLRRCGYSPTGNPMAAAEAVYGRRRSA